MLDDEKCDYCYGTGDELARTCLKDARTGKPVNRGPIPCEDCKGTGCSAYFFFCIEKVEIVSA